MKIFAVLFLLLSIVCYADTPEEKQDYEFELIKPIGLAGGKKLTSIKQSEIESLRDNLILSNKGLEMHKTIRIEGTDQYLKAIVYVKTPRQYKEAFDLGYEQSEVPSFIQTTISQS